MNASSRLGRKEMKQTLYVILAAVLCFIGPTYFVAASTTVIPQMYAAALGFVSFLIGIVFVFKLVED